MPSNPHFAFGLASIQGRRDYQQDLGGASPTMLVVCDGMGGHQGGDKASRAAMSAVVDWRDFSNLGGLFRTAQKAIAPAAGEDAGTTMVLVRTTGTPYTLVCAAAGDSPAWHYDVKARKLKLLYQPHRARNGGLTKGIFGHDPDGQYCRPKICRFKVSLGDLILVGSDGLVDGGANASVVQRVISANSEASPTTLARKLIMAAYLAGSDDNITATVGRIVR